MNKIKWLFLAIILGQSIGYAGPLHDAAKFDGNLEEVKRLLLGGAGVDDLDENGQTALMLAAYFGNTEIVKELLKWTSSWPKDTLRRTALMIAAQNDHIEIMKLIMDWSIEKQILLKFRDLEWIHKKLGTTDYQRKFTARGALLKQRKAEIERVTGIPKDPVNIIHEYMGND